MREATWGKGGGAAGDVGVNATVIVTAIVTIMQCVWTCSTMAAMRLREGKPSGVDTMEVPEG